MFVPCSLCGAPASRSCSHVVLVAVAGWFFPVLYVSSAFLPPSSCFLLYFDSLLVLVCCALVCVPFVISTMLLTCVSQVCLSQVELSWPLCCWLLSRVSAHVNKVEMKLFTLVSFIGDLCFACHRVTWHKEIWNIIIMSSSSCFQHLGTWWTNQHKLRSHFSLKWPKSDCFALMQPVSDQHRSDFYKCDSSHLDMCS